MVSRAIESGSNGPVGMDEDEHRHDPPPSSSATQQFHFNSIRLFRGQKLGSGAYGMVCIAQCDKLRCAAKLLHPALFQFNDPGSKSTYQRFRQECHFLSAIKHPNIVQYLGTSHDTELSQLVLLMELMDENLTTFLARSSAPLPLHTQVNITQDIVVALDYLHSNSIAHRDLSSNNVLLIAGKRAKLTDFGMSKLVEDMSCRHSPCTHCPGTAVYMAPEALRTPPIYSKKLDCFSVGVLIVQIITRKFPFPSLAKKCIEYPSSPTGMIEIPVPELQRREEDVSLVGPDHVLRPLALSCLQDIDVKRSTASEMCEVIVRVKSSGEYLESLQEEEERRREGEGEGGREGGGEDGGGGSGWGVGGRASTIEKELEAQREHFLGELQALRTRVDCLSFQLQEKESEAAKLQDQLEAVYQDVRQRDEALLHSEGRIEELSRALREGSADVDLLRVDNLKLSEDLKDLQQEKRDSKSREGEDVQKRIVFLQYQLQSKEDKQDALEQQMREERKRVEEKARLVEEQREEMQRLRVELEHWKTEANARRPAPQDSQEWGQTGGGGGGPLNNNNFVAAIPLGGGQNNQICDDLPQWGSTSGSGSGRQGNSPPKGPPMILGAVVGGQQTTAESPSGSSGRGTRGGRRVVPATHSSSSPTNMAALEADMEQKKHELEKVLAALEAERQDSRALRCRVRELESQVQREQELEPAIEGLRHDVERLSRELDGSKEEEARTALRLQEKEVALEALGKRTREEQRRLEESREVVRGLRGEIRAQEMHNNELVKQVQQQTRHQNQQPPPTPDATPPTSLQRRSRCSDPVQRPPSHMGGGGPNIDPLEAERGLREKEAVIREKCAQLKEMEQKLDEEEFKHSNVVRNLMEQNDGLLVLARKNGEQVRVLTRQLDDKVRELNRLRKRSGGGGGGGFMSNWRTRTLPEKEFYSEGDQMGGSALKSPSTLVPVATTNHHLLSQTHHEVMEPTTSTTTSSTGSSGSILSPSSIFKWDKGCPDAPDTLYSDTAVVKDHVVYFAKSLTGIVHAFDSEKSEWSVLPQCPHTHFTLAVVNGLLTSVGGEESYNTTNKLLSYSNGDSWFEAYLPMSLARRLPAAVSLKEALVVAGGETSLGVATDSVELMSATGLEWCLVASLPRPVSNMTGVACAGGIYLMGGQDQTNKTLSVFWCSLAMLAQSSSSSDAFFPPLSSSVPPGLGFSSYTPPPSLSPWQWLPDAPAFLSTCVLFQGRVVLVGGCDAQYRCTNKVWSYNSPTRSWVEVTSIPTPRRECLVAVLPDNRLMVVGGYTAPDIIGSESNIVEIGSIVQ